MRATTWQNQQNECAPSEDSGTSAQSDQSLLCAQWVAKDRSFHDADSEDSDQTGRMRRLIWVFAGRTAALLVLSCRGSYEPAREIMALFVLRKLILQTCMRSYAVWLDVWFWSDPSSTSIVHVSEQRRLWRDCAGAQARLSLRWSPMW